MFSVPVFKVVELVFTAIYYSVNSCELFYCQQREIPPLSLEDGTSLAFVSCEGSGILLVAVTHSAKGKQVLEFKAWDVMSSLGFSAKELIVQDSQRSTVNETKFKRVLLCDF